MNFKHERNEAPRGNPFWILLIVILLLGGDYGYRVFTLGRQYQQLMDARFALPQRDAVVGQSQQMEERLQKLSIDLIQLGKTNSIANQIVREFNIQWNPGPTPTPTTVSGLTETNSPAPVR
jgi:hypothetical protein